MLLEIISQYKEAWDFCFTLIPHSPRRFVEHTLVRSVYIVAWDTYSLSNLFQNCFWCQNIHVNCNELSQLFSQWQVRTAEGGRSLLVCPRLPKRVVSCLNRKNEAAWHRDLQTQCDFGVFATISRTNTIDLWSWLRNGSQWQAGSFERSFCAFACLSRSLSVWGGVFPGKALSFSTKDVVSVLLFLLWNLRCIVASVVKDGWMSCFFCLEISLGTSRPTSRIPGDQALIFMLQALKVRDVWQIWSPKENSQRGTRFIVVMMSFLKRAWLALDCYNRIIV